MVTDYLLTYKSEIRWKRLRTESGIGTPVGMSSCENLGGVGVGVVEGANRLTGAFLGGNGASLHLP